MKFPAFKNPFKGETTTTAPKPTAEQMKDVIDLAGEFDDVVKRPGFTKILEFMAREVQNEIASSTQKRYDPEAMRVDVIYWNAKRDLLDSLQAYILDIQRNRDEIVSQFRKSKEQDVAVI